MTSSITPTPSSHPASAAMEEALAGVESRLSALGEALRARDGEAIDRHSTELHRALSRAVDHFMLAAKRGSLPPAMRRRLAAASGQVAAQRESLARATAALDRAIDVLMPRDTPALYGAGGTAERGLRGGTLQA